MAESERAQGGGPDARADAGGPSFELELPAVAISVATGRHAVRRFCDGQSLDHGKIAIAVSEALTNVVVHAYRDTGGGTMRISAAMLVDVLLVVVSDDGQGMTPRDDSPGMGMGLLLIDQLAGAVQVDSDHGGTRLKMRFARGAGSHTPA
jgi:anti-sigma regulatory factor (Ser/Thr protein kinase)